MKKKIDFEDESFRDEIREAIKVGQYRNYLTKNKDNGIEYISEVFDEDLSVDAVIKVIKKLLN